MIERIKPAFLRGKKTILRPLEPEDLPEVYRYINDPEVLQHLAGYWPQTMARERAWLEHLEKRDNQIVFAVDAADDENKGVFLGTMGMHSIDYRNQHCTTGAALGARPDLLSKGYGADAKMTQLHYAFTQLNMRKVCSRVYATNGRSKRYLEKCGYKCIGVHKQHIYNNGEFVDECLMEVFKDDFMELWYNYTQQKGEWQ